MKGYKNIKYHSVNGDLEIFPLDTLKMYLNDLYIRKFLDKFIILMRMTHILPLFEGETIEQNVGTRIKLL